MDRTEELIQRYLRSKTAPGRDRKEASGGYPSPADFSAFIEDRLKGAELERMLAHLKRDADDRAFVAGIRGLLEDQKAAEQAHVPEALMARVKALEPGRRTPRRAPKPSSWPLWALGAALLLAASFIFRGYFIQLTAAAVLFGVKAIVDQKAAKTQILIYKALEDAEKSHLHGPSSRL